MPNNQAQVRVQLKQLHRKIKAAENSLKTMHLHARNLRWELEDGGNPDALKVSIESNKGGIQELQELLASYRDEVKDIINQGAWPTKESKEQCNR